MSVAQPILLRRLTLARQFDGLARDEGKTGKRAAPFEILGKT
jgi:hypothetical protein